MGNNRELSADKVSSHNTDTTELDAKVKLSEAGSSEILDAQNYINELADTDGVSGEGDANRKVYSSHNVIASGDDRKVAIGKLDTQVKVNIDKDGAQDTAIGNNTTNIGTNATDIQAIEDSVGAASGICPLDGSGLVDSSYLPSYVDDVIEAADYASLPVTGETGKIYVTLDDNKQYRWSGSAYVQITSGAVDSVNGQTGIVVLNKTDVGLTNVTNDAQLKRAANDINTFTEKATPVDGDMLLIEDSADSFNKKKVNLANMIGGSGGVGSPSIYKIFDAESGDDLGDGSTGNNAAFLGGGTMVGTVGPTTGISGDTSYRYIQHGSNDCTNDYWASAAFAVPARSQDRDTHTFKMSYRYTGSDDDISMIIYGGSTASVLKEIPLKGAFTHIEEIFDNPSNTLSVGFHVKSYTANAQFLFDDIVLDDEAVELRQDTYIENGSGKRGTSGWTAYANTTPGDTPDDFGGTPTKLAISVSTSTPLEDGISMLIAGGSNPLGEGFYYQFDINARHKAMMLLLDISASLPNISAYKFFLVGSNDNFVADFQIITSVNGGSFNEGLRTLASLQTSPDATKYRLCIHCLSTATPPVGIYFIVNQLWDQPVAVGPVVTDWEEETPTWGGVITGSTGFSQKLEYMRVGSVAKIKANFVLGVGGSCPGSIYLDMSTLPFSVDTSYTSLRPVVGIATGRETGVQNFNTLARYDTTNNRVEFPLNDGSTWGGAIPFTWGAADELFIEFEVPILGWSSNAKMSTDFGNREIYFEGAGNGGTALTANVTDIDFLTVRDSAAAWDGSKFIAPEPGNYTLEGCVDISGSQAPVLSLYKSGVQSKICGLNAAVAGLALFSGTIYLEAGENVSIRSSVSFTISNTTLVHNISIVKLATPQTLLEGEKVFGFANTTGAANGAMTTTSTIIYDNVIDDSHGMLNTATGVLTAAKSGILSLSANFLWDRKSWVVANTFEGRIYAGVALLKASVSRVDTTALAYVGVSVEITGKRVNKGDPIQVSQWKSNTASASLIVSAIHNTLSWEIR